MKCLLNLFQYCFCFMFWSFGHKACEILTSWPGIKPVPASLEGKSYPLNCQGTQSSLIFFKCCDFFGISDAFVSSLAYWCQLLLLYFALEFIVSILIRIYLYVILQYFSFFIDTRTFYSYFSSPGFCAAVFRHFTSTNNINPTIDYHFALNSWLSFTEN